MKQIFITILMLLAVSGSTAQTIIPQPQQVAQGNGLFKATVVKFVIADERLTLNKELLKSAFTENPRAKNTITLALDSKAGTAQGYTLAVTPTKITITGADEAGVFYGVQSLLQLTSGGSVPVCEIVDSPRYEWRGFMLDEARHFFGKAKVKQTLDMMSRYKLNKLHWHLTDDEGWRIEIKKYPRLTAVGGKGTWSNPEAGAQYYTQSDIREIVEYAAVRHIEIIPEIDMPGHARASNNAYPEYSGGGVPEHPNFTFNPGKEEVYQYLTDILREVSQLFPSKHLHIGGDEVSFGIKAWQDNEQIKQLMAREDLTTLKQVEWYFMHRMADTIAMLGKRLIGWDELMDSQAKPSTTTIMWWRHDKVDILRKALAMGYPTIMCPRRPLYFDFIQDKKDKWGRVWDGFCPLDDVYNFPDQGFGKWALDSQKSIIGIQANLWTERVQNQERFDYMVYPRLAALAESAWSRAQVKSFENFNSRMEREYKLYDKLGLYYYAPGKPEAVGCEKPKVTVPMDYRD